MKKRMIIMLAIVGTVFAGLIGFQQFKAYMMMKWLAGNSQPPATVTTATAGFEAWQPLIRSVGTLRARNGIDVVSEVAGVVRKVHFNSGDEVKAGELLVELDSDVERAQLAAAEAAAELARLNYERDKAQFAVKAVSQAQLDFSLADMKTKKAQAAQLRAVLNKMRIRAPFAGRLGVTTVSAGQYITPGAMIVPLQANNPIMVDFTVPQKRVAEVKVGQQVRLSSNTFPEKEFNGEIVAIDSKVSTATRNVRVEARIDNSDGKLLPGMFAEVRIDAGASHKYLTLPQTAIAYNAYGPTLFVSRPGKVGEDGKEGLPTAEQIFVKTGPVRGDQVAILSGIKEGDVVVTSGQMKLKNGTPLAVNNSVLPANEAAPAPQEH